MRVIESRGRRAGWSRPRGRVRAHAAPVLGVIGSALVVYVLLGGRPVIRSDEAWFTWVVERMRNGDPLYGRIYFVSTPLGAWLGTALSIVGGVSVRTMRAFSVVIFVASSVVAWRTARRAQLGVLGRLIMLAALFVYASPVAHFASIYSSLAILFSLIAFAAAFAWFDDASHALAGHWSLLSVAGLAAGLSIAAKPNTGLLTVAALVLAVALGNRSQGRKVFEHTRQIVLGAAAVVAVMVVLVAPGGGLRAFVGDVFLDKGDYLRVMSRGFFSSFSGVFDIFPGHGAHVLRVVGSGRHVLRTASFADRFLATFPLVPFAGVALLAWAAWYGRRARDPRFILCAAFFVTGWASALPQLGPQHMTEAMPMLVATAAAGTGVALQTQRPRSSNRSPLAIAVLAAWLVFGGMLVSARAVDTMARYGRPASTLPHMEGTPIDPSIERTVRDDVADLRALTGGQVFIVRTDAAFYYLAGELRNPTPYDFAARSDFGRAGEAGVVQMLARHEVRFACVPDVGPPRHGRPDFTPRRIIGAVRARFRYVGRVSACSLYEDPAFASVRTESAALRGQ